MLKTEIRDFHLKLGEGEPLPCRAPCSVLSVLTAAKKIDRRLFSGGKFLCNEILSGGCEFFARFNVGAGEFALEHLYLCASGIDSRAEIIVNGRTLIRTESLFRTYMCDIKNFVTLGENTLSIRFAGAAGADNRPPYQMLLGMSDIGIAGKIELMSFSGCAISGVETSQRHADGKVVIDIAVDTLGDAENAKAVATLVSPSGKTYYSGIVRGRGTLSLPDPVYWWPKSLGAPYLYDLTVTLYSDSEAADTYECKIGIRTFSLDTSEAGVRKYIPEINGVRFCMMGAVVEPPALLLPDITNTKYDSLLRDAVKAGYNTVRVRGDGLYPSEGFLSLCDKYGLCVWVDLPTYSTPDLACYGYLSDAREFIHRAGSHPSLCVIAGNCGGELTARSGADLDSYRDIFGKKLPELCQSHAKDAVYLPSTPYAQSPAVPGSRTGLDYHAAYFEELTDGEMPAFCSELGYPSFPAYRTFLDECGGEVNPLTPEGEEINRLPGGNAALCAEILKATPYPYSLEQLVYASGIAAAEYARRTVEYLRSKPTGCRGIIIRSLNGTAPAVSAGAIDATGRKRPLYYYSQRFFSPVLLMAHEDGGRLEFVLSNQRRRQYDGTLRVSLCNASNDVVYTVSAPVTVPEMSVSRVYSCDISDILPGHEREYYLRYSVSGDDVPAYSATSLFVPSHKFLFRDPKIRAELRGSGTAYTLTLSASAFAMSAEVSFEHTEARFSDNCVDITADGSVKINVDVAGGITSAERLLGELNIISYYDIGR